MIPGGKNIYQENEWDTLISRLNNVYLGPKRGLEVSVREMERMGLHAAAQQSLFAAVAELQWT